MKWGETQWRTNSNLSKVIASEQCLVVWIHTAEEGMPAQWHDWTGYGNYHWEMIIFIDFNNLSKIEWKKTASGNMSK